MVYLHLLLLITLLIIIAIAFRSSNTLVLIAWLCFLFFFEPHKQTNVIDYWNNPYVPLCGVGGTYTLSFSTADDALIRFGLL